MDKTAFISQAALDDLSNQAKQSARLRKNYNFHQNDSDMSHRLLNAMEPDSYIQPHRHLDKNKDETLIILRGKMGLIVFDDQGRIEKTVLLEPNGETVLVNIPHGTYHSWVSLEANSVFFEAKAGPYLPLTGEEKASWAPEEGAPGVDDYLQTLKQLFQP